MRYNGDTLVYGIMGNPVGHSLSPAMHNAAFAHLGLNKVYVPFPVQDLAKALDGFRALGIRGVSVTIPHKQAVIPLLDRLDPIAAKIGAVNTLVIENGFITGLNTDWLGANNALKQTTPLTGKKILLLGAGGSARAIGFGLLEEKARLTLASRSPEKGQALARILNCPWLPLAQAATFAGDILINATSVGMLPHQEDSPINEAALTGFGTVMDIVYAPLKTKLLAQAAAAGCTTVDGLTMLLLQGAAQFELWTGAAAPLEIMRESLLQGITA